jgi:hypothetical protein
MVTSVINQTVGAAVKLNVITKIRKYRRIHEKHHFIPMAMEVHGTHGHDINCLIKECVRLLHNRPSRDHLSLSFYIQFFKQHFSIAFQRA